MKQVGDAFRRDKLQLGDIPVDVDTVLRRVLRNYPHVIMITDDPKVISNYGVIEWVIKGNLKEQNYINTFHSASLNSARALNVIDVVAFVIYQRFFSRYTASLNETEGFSLLEKIDSSIIEPLTEMLSKNMPFTARTDELYWHHLKAIRQELANGSCKKRGTKHYFWLDCSMDPEYDAESTESIWSDLDIFSVSEVRASAIKGFLKIFDKGAANPDEDYYPALDWFIDWAHIFDYEHARHRLMKNLYQRKDGDQNVRDYLLGYYEHRRSFFNEQFAICKEYEFVDRCHYEEYEIIDDLVRQVNISMQDYAEVHEFFPAGKVDRNKPAEHIKQAKRKLRDPRIYRTLIFEALSEAFNHIQHAALPLAESPEEKPTAINIYPNRIKEDNEARPLGDYVALKFKYQNQWWILVDGLKPNNAVYLWHGERYTDGLEIFMQAKMVARHKDGVYHRNHTFNTRSALDSYRLIMSDAGCAKVLE